MQDEQKTGGVNIFEGGFSIAGRCCVHLKPGDTVWADGERECRIIGGTADRAILRGVSTGEVEAVQWEFVHTSQAPEFDSRMSPDDRQVHHLGQIAESADRLAIACEPDANPGPRLTEACKAAWEAVAQLCAATWPAGEAKTA